MTTFILAWLCLTLFLLLALAIAYAVNCEHDIARIQRDANFSPAAARLNRYERARLRTAERLRRMRRELDWISDDLVVERGCPEFLIYGDYAEGQDWENQ